MQSEHIRITDLKQQYDRLTDILEDYLFRAGIEGKNAMRFSLIAEEAVRLARSIVEEGESVEMWFEGDNRASCIFVQTTGKLDPDQEEEFISASSKGANEVKGTFFDEIKKRFTRPKKATWSLAEYEEKLSAQRAKDPLSQEAWEDLERSVLAKLADEITVSVEDDEALMMIKKVFA